MQAMQDDWGIGQHDAEDGLGAGPGPLQIIYIKNPGDFFTTASAPAGSVLRVYSPSPAASGASVDAKITGGGTLASPPQVDPVQILLDGTPGTLVITWWPVWHGQPASATIAITGAAAPLVDACAANPALCAGRIFTQPTPPPTKAGGTGPSAGCTAGNVADTVTGACLAPCAGGGAPANGVCPPGGKPTSTTTYALVAGGVIVLGGVLYYVLR